MGGVERMMREEAHQERSALCMKRRKPERHCRGMPELVIRRAATDEIRALLKEDRALAILVLANGTSRRPRTVGGSHLGARHQCLSHSCDRRPGTLTDEEVDALA